MEAVLCGQSLYLVKGNKENPVQVYSDKLMAKNTKEQIKQRY